MKVAPRDQWIALLAKLVSPAAPEEAATGLRSMMPMLADLPDQAFNLKSLEYVARQCRRMPSYGELRSSLSAWWIENRPPEAVPGNRLMIGHDSETEGTKWERRCQEMRREWDDPSGIRDRIRTCNGDEKFLGALRSLVGRWAPQHLHLVPPKPERPVEASAEAKDNRPRFASFPMSDAELLVEYERLAKSGNQAAATRARMLRARLEPAQ